MGITGDGSRDAMVEKEELEAALTTRILERKGSFYVSVVKKE